MYCSDYYFLIKKFLLGIYMQTEEILLATWMEWAIQANFSHCLAKEQTIGSFVHFKGKLHL